MPISPAELWDLRRRHADGDIPGLRHPQTATPAPAALGGIPKE
jgi:hypothetical protein